MRVLYRKIASVKRNLKHLNTSENTLSCAQLSYCIEEIQKQDGTNEVMLLIRNLVTNELSYKNPISLYYNKNFLALFSRQDTQIIMKHVIYQIKHNVLEAIKFEGYDYSGDHEVCVFYDMRFKQEQFKESMKLATDNNIFDFLREKDRLYLVKST